MPVAELDGIEIAYELVGEGQPWVLTPGGRFTKEVGGLPEMARALAEAGRQVLTWDRPNCGASSVVFRGPSESEVQAEALGALLRHLELGPTVIAGGSGGARVSLLTAARNPDVTAGLAMWWISGGVPGLLQLASYYCMPSADAAWHGGMAAVAELDQWQEVQASNPRNQERILAMDRQEFLAVMDRWAVAYCPCDDSLVPGLDDADIARLQVPILVFRSGPSDMSHTRATSEALAAGLPGAELVEPPWGDDEWNERRAAIEETGSLFVRWPRLVPQLVEWEDRVIGAPAREESRP
ncbi:MAG: alpha/beta fold hydrolase [Acidimicrobiia bacterium]